MDTFLLFKRDSTIDTCTTRKSLHTHTSEDRSQRNCTRPSPHAHATSTVYYVNGSILLIYVWYAKIVKIIVAGVENEVALS